MTYKFSIKMDNNKITDALKIALEKKLDAALNDIADFIGSESDRILRDDDEGSFDTGFLANSLVVSKDKKLYKEVGYSAMYAGYVEYGTSPHGIPIDVIYNWVNRKKKDLNIKYDKKKTTVFGGKVYNTAILKVSWAIFMSIKKKGTEPAPFLRPSFNLGKSKTSEFIKKAMKKN